MKTIMTLLPNRLREALLLVPEQTLGRITEIRLRTGAPVYIYGQGREWSLWENGLTSVNGYIFSKEEAEQFWRNISDYSSYTLLESQRQGFVTVKGGHRIGLCGELAVENGQVRHMRRITSFCVRIAHQCIGCGARSFDFLSENGRPLSALIISPPGCGKTTLLRDLARMFSDNGCSVCIADERNEIAACRDGVPTLQVGKRTDVYAGCPKDIAMENMLRSLRPELIITDELGGGGDIPAAAECVKCGVSVIASAHGSSYEDIAERGMCGPLIKYNAFQRFIILSDRQGPGTLESVLDGSGRPIYERCGARRCC